MSRGLSVQQRQILGLARAVNRAVNGGQLLAGEVELKRWRVPALCAHGFPEITARYVMHLLHGLPLADEGGRGSTGRRNGWGFDYPGFFRPDPRKASLKASTSRAIRSLERRGMLIFRPSWGHWPGARVPRPGNHEYREFVEALVEPEAFSLVEGSALTPAGAAAGADCEPDMSEDEIITGVRALQFQPHAYYTVPLLAALDRQRRR